MPNKFICNMSTEELTRLYIDEKRTLPEMCEIIGVKNVITAGKILRSRGIVTNTNTRKANKVKHGMSDEAFKKYLETEYTSGKTLKEIGDTLGVTIACVRKYFVKYGIKRRTKKEYVNRREKNHNWKGGRRATPGGYIQLHMPQHPNCDKHGYVYEHRYVMEQAIGRYLTANEVVHHIDENKSNNDISNLMLLTNSEHVALHMMLNKNKKIKRNEESRTLSKGVVC